MTVNDLVYFIISSSFGILINGSFFALYCLVMFLGCDLGTGGWAGAGKTKPGLIGREFSFSSLKLSTTSFCFCSFS